MFGRFFLLILFVFVVSGCATAPTEPRSFLPVFEGEWNQDENRPIPGYMITTFDRSKPYIRDVNFLSKNKKETYATYQYHVIHNAPESKTSLLLIRTDLYRDKGDYWYEIWELGFEYYQFARAGEEHALLEKPLLSVGMYPSCLSPSELRQLWNHFTPDDPRLIRFNHRSSCDKGFYYATSTTYTRANRKNIGRRPGDRY